MIHLDLHTGLGDHGKKPPDSTVSGHIPVPGEIDGVPCIGSVSPSVSVSGRGMFENAYRFKRGHVNVRNV